MSLKASLVTILFIGCFYLNLTGNATAASKDIYQKIEETIPLYLNKPYKLYREGPKRFDCSGFVWRVLYESGVPVQRTSCRKLYLMLSPTTETERFHFANIIFFRNLKHCGIIRDSDSFYHASRLLGTAVSTLNGYWRTKVFGIKQPFLKAKKYYFSKE
ncbi:C40 family peptidase [Methylomonas sp. LL1]|uniref:NlpC/P60 family protein n=1 Tax=Methylomonas sp. LL1 TaxID=2785785 RepID=UPI0018C3D5D2|nr:NlpC/P60 family protein [Methylomonas sp. LL1]QPK63989.1 C40 family peptidase [Methylomonas sp. LL1]CAG1021811.1 putative lipoprotein NlpC [Methylococcales bacterium]